MPLVTHRQRPATALTRDRWVVPSRGGPPALIPTGTVLQDTANNFNPQGTNLDGSKMYWTESNQSLILESTDAQAGYPYVNPAQTFDADTVNFPAGRGTNAQRIRETFIAHDGSLLAAVVSDNGYGFLIRSPDDSSANFSTTPVLHLGSQNGLDGATLQGLGNRPLGTFSFENGVVNGVPATMYAEYVTSATDDEELTAWFTTDGGVTWSIFWKSNISGGTRHREHIHSVHFLSTGEWLFFCGDSAVQSGIVKGPSTSATWATINNVSNATIALDSNFAIINGSEEYRVISGTEFNGAIFYALDSGSQWGVHRLAIDFQTGDDHVKVYDGLNGRLTNDMVRSSGALATNAGNLLVFDWLEGGGSPSTSTEIRVMSSSNGATWADAASILIDTAKTPGFFFATSVFQLPSGEIIMGGAQYYRDLRDDPTGSVTPPEIAIFIESGFQAPDAAPTVVAPAVQVA